MNIGEKGFVLPEGFKMGVATSATQIEGGDRGNSWFKFFAEGGIRDGGDPSVACDHYSRYAEDIELMSRLGVKVYRMGIEWSRIEPQQGVFNEEVLQHYKNELLELRKRGIEPLLTLHHFTVPLWFEELGGFLNPNCVDIFLHFVRKVITKLGRLVADYITINEPNVYAFMGYYAGEWPPCVRKREDAFAVMQNMAVCHIKAYELIHELRRMAGCTDTKVSFAQHLRVFAPFSKFNPIDLIASRIMETQFQTALTHAMNVGVFRKPFKQPEGVQKGKYYDFIAINYYSRTAVKGGEQSTFNDVPKNDLGWEIYPKGLVTIARKMFKKYRAPIWITENGVADSADRMRPKFLHDHLQAIATSGLPIERYYHWTLTDNFEWKEGYMARFGLVEMYFPTQKRTVRPSGEFFAEIAALGGCTPEMYDKYIKEE